MSEQVLVIDYEQGEENIEDSIEEFFKKLEKEESLDVWMTAIHDKQVKIYKIQNGKFKELKVKLKVTYSVAE